MQRKNVDDEQKDLYLSLIAHELKTPVTSIQGFAQAIQRKLYPKIIEFNNQTPLTKNELITIFDNTEILLAQIDRIKKIIDDIDMITSLKATTNSAICKKVDMCQIINHAVKIVSEQWSNAKINFISDTVRNAKIHGDEVKLEQLFINIVSNAVKFSANKAKIVLECKDEQDQYVIQCTDNGSGIAESDLPYIFDLYYRGSQLDNKKVAGLGLGLYICKQIVELHKGTIAITSKLRKGTTVTITFPKVEE